MYDNFLILEKEAAFAAAEIHLTYFTKDAQVSEKAVSHDKVTIADVEAGGSLTDWSGRFPDTETSPIAASNGLLHDVILSILRQR